MDQLRRAAHLFFRCDDHLVPAIVNGKLGLRPAQQLLAISVIDGREYPIAAELVSLMIDIPVEDWVATDTIVNQHGVTQALLNDLVEKGILVSNRTDEAAARRRAQDEKIRESAWHPYSLLHFTMSKWRDQLPDMPGTLEGMQEMIGTRTEHWRQAIDTSGDCLPSFYSIPEPRDHIDLPLITKSDGLYETLTRRKTTRFYDRDRVVTLAELATTLYYVWGCHGYIPLADSVGTMKKTSPSGGGLHPVEVYPLIRRVEGIDPGMYHYNVQNHSLELMKPLSEEEVEDLALTFMCGQFYFAEAQVLFIMTARFFRNFWKYRNNPRTYLVVLMDAAHLSQTLQLVCSDLGLGSFITTAINGGNIEEQLGLDPVEQGALAMCGMGRRFPNEEEIPALQVLDPQFLPYVPRQTRV